LTANKARKKPRNNLILSPLPVITLRGFSVKRERHSELDKKRALILAREGIKQIVERIEAVFRIGEIERAEGGSEPPAEKAVKVKPVVAAVILGKQPEPEVRGKIVIPGENVKVRALAVWIRRKFQAVERVGKR